MVEKVSQEIQEYLEAIQNLSRNGETVTVAQIAERMKVSPPAVEDVLKRLSEGKYIEYSDGKVLLTDTGRRIGVKISRKHRLLESFLYNVLGIGKDKVHEEACEMEHTLSDDAETALCRFLGHPSKCPDDYQPIQPCDLPFTSCEECMKARAKGQQQVGKRKENLISVADLKEHQEGKVAFIRGDNKVLRRLLDMGITTNTPVHVIKVAPFDGPVELAVRGSKLVLGRQIASDVFVDIAGMGVRHDD